MIGAGVAGLAAVEQPSHWALLIEPDVRPEVAEQISQWVLNSMLEFDEDGAGEGAMPSQPRQNSSKNATVP